MDKLKEVLGNRVSRRKFMAGIGAGVGATAAVAFAAGCSSGNTATTPVVTTPAPATLTDADILNFALNLEYLEAEFYLHAATGSGLSSADALTGAGAVTGGSMVPATGAATSYGATLFTSYINEVAQDELNHVRALQAAITASGGTPVARPAIDLTFFSTLATAAKITTAAPFTPFDNPQDFLLGSFIFEDVGVTAYTGAAPLITSGAILSAAAGIQAVEAYHAAIVRTLIVSTDFNVNMGTQLEVIANQISTLRASLGGGDETMLSTTSIVAASSANAIAFGRTPDQVMHIVYGAGGGAGLSSGGFFPAGLNGTIKQTGS